MQRLQHIWIDGQVVQKVGDSDSSGVKTTKDEEDGLGKNLLFSQTCMKKLRTSELPFSGLKGISYESKIWDFSIIDKVHVEIQL